MHTHPAARAAILILAGLLAGAPRPVVPASTDRVPSNAHGTAPDDLRPEDLVYLGAFRLPGTEDGPQSWSYGGRALTYVPTGDPGGGADGFPGSLYGGGHAHHQRVSEISIPAPAIPASFDAAGYAQLPVAQTLQPFADLTGGLRAQAGVDHFGDLAWRPAQPGQSADLLYWTVYEYYNVAGIDFPSHGQSGLNLSQPAAAGPWRLGPAGDPVFHSMRTARYLFNLPQAFADQHLGGKSLVSGRHREAGCCGSSRGPALFAYAPWQDGQPPAPGSHLGAIALLHYPSGGNHFPEYRACDDWSGAVYAQGGGRDAVLVAGRKALGAERYGLGQPGDCDFGIQGYHCDPYESQILFYSPRDLAAVAAGTVPAWQVLPHARLRAGPPFWPTCRAQLGAIAFDEVRTVLYVIQPEAFEDRPLVHVFRVGGNDRLFANGFEVAD
ncbi:MAG: hypothetical protein KF823_00860 [Xanthomonadales bacterium]|nr:hypothetical protein [Xanthomonadales bacterium]